MESQPQNPKIRNNPENFHPCFTCIRKRQWNFAILGGFYFHKLHLKIKPWRKFLNLQYSIAEKLEHSLPIKISKLKVLNFRKKCHAHRHNTVIQVSLKPATPLSCCPPLIQRVKPYKPSVFFVGHRQTVQTQTRHHRMWRLIRVYTVCL